MLAACRCLQPVAETLGQLAEQQVQQQLNAVNLQSGATADMDLPQQAAADGAADTFGDENVPIDSNQPADEAKGSAKQGAVSVEQQQTARLEWTVEHAFVEALVATADSQQVRVDGCEGCMAPATTCCRLPDKD